MRSIFGVALLLACSSQVLAAEQCNPRDTNYFKCLADRAADRSKGTTCTCQSPHNNDLGCCDAKATGAIDPTCNTKFDTVTYTCGGQRPIQCCLK